ncbi:cellulose binding domain-containing protein [Streptomyces sp. NPDC050147]|uniref:cellulose binding domain-containing protein n=1 Tax=Streptomyces sp. NPDC050147 TaxID=3155513 RepID=UPI0034315A9C
MTYKGDSGWSTGFTATVTVKNMGSNSADGGKLSWTYPAGQHVTSAWDATATHDGTAVAARDADSNADWNRTIRPGAAASFGPQGTYSGSNPSPAAFTLDGHACI